MRCTGRTFIGQVALFCLMLMTFSCQRAKDQDSWLSDLHDEARALFYQALRDEISVHPERSRLSSEERVKIMEAETRYEGLFDILINIFYQKDEPEYSRLLERDDKESRSRFRQMYSDLSLFSAHQFVESFFATDSSTELIRKNVPAYKDLDAVDLVIRSIGYHARLDLPQTERAAKSLSPEFDKQRALHAAKFHEAHKITKGKGVKIAVLDTGIDQSHPIFRNTRWGKHFSLVGRVGKPWESDAPLVDWGFHGTLVTSIVARYAPEAQITVYKFGDGDTQNDPPYQLLSQCTLAAAIYRAVHDGNDIISISASGSGIDPDYLREACEYADDNNRVIVSGALYSRWFNQGNTRNFPSQYDTVVSVTAAERREDGTYGYWDVCAAQETNDIAAPNDIFGAFPTYIDREDIYVPSISAAIPVVSSLFALTMSAYPRLGTEGPGEYAETIKNLVFDHADPQMVGFEGFSPECGHGLIDAEKTVKSAVLLNINRQLSQKKNHP
jgi:hypothetical protein